jgi:ligand-binding SRPBCC domain-containing protein
MTCFEADQWLPVELPKVFAFFSYPENLPRIMPPEMQVVTEWAALVPPVVKACAIFEILEMDKAAGAGSEFLFSFRAFPWAPMRMEWLSRIEEYEPGNYFRDTQLSGPMRRWSHRHEFQSENRNGVNGTRIRDRVEFEIGYGWAGKLLERYFVLPAMRRSFEHRQGQVQRALL